jgi:hypothetical protein
MCAGRHEHCFLPFGGVKGGSGGGDSGTGCCEGLKGRTRMSVVQRHFFVEWFILEKQRK